MINYFESEFNNIAKRSSYMKNIKTVDSACLFRLSDIITAKICFITTKYGDRYDTLEITIMNRTSGTIDKQKIRIDTMIGKISIDGCSRIPYISEYDNKLSWYGFTPTNEHYTRIAIAIDNYLSVFTDPPKSSNKKRTAV